MTSLHKTVQKLNTKLETTTLSVVLQKVESLLQMMSFSCTYFSDFLILPNENILFLSSGKKNPLIKINLRNLGDHHETYAMGFSKTIQEDPMFPITGTGIGKVPFYWTPSEKVALFF